MNRLTVALLCLMLCLTGIAAPKVSGAVLTTSARTALVLCLQQEYLMRDAYEDILAVHPTLASFGTVAQDEADIIAMLKRVFVRLRIAVPADTQESVAQTIAGRAANFSMAHMVAIDLERSAARVMDRLLQTTRSQDVLNAITLARAASLGSHTTAFAAEQASLSTPALPDPVLTQRVVAFTPSQKGSVFLALLKDESVDVIELDGTYHLPYTRINVDRTRPILVRPAAGATVIMSGSAIGGDPQFEFGEGGTAGNITMQGLIFDGFILAQSGIIQAKDAHDITLNDMIVRNCRANGTYAQPWHAWAVYVSSNATVHVTNLTLDRWTVDGSAGQMGALQVCGGLRVTARGWSVSNARYAVYATRTQSPLTDFVLDDWTISGSGAPMWASPKVSVYVENASGRFSNMHDASSGTLLNAGTPKLTNAGDNSISVVIR